MSGVRLAVAALASATALVLVTPSAHADTWRHRDATGDALVTDRYDGDVVVGPRTVASQEHADITNLNVRYTRDDLRVAISIRAVSQLSSSVAIWIVSSRGDAYSVFDDLRYGNRSTGLLRSAHADGNASGFECDGFRVSSTRAGLVAVVPRVCLRSPYRVRVGVRAAANAPVRDDRRGEGRRAIYDDALVTGGRTDDLFPTLGPWVVGR